ncbi:hypothetical protein CRE_03705 [Caenorhabditis remanei]|uniref:Uncharacterized protein n=2 Tax=Caenorhabditis remanei TaxID=31234 RepID=E3LXT9_CAERE|nr:hypothetical protein CRE_03705 [Caenorhabditis remanei]
MKMMTEDTTRKWTFGQTDGDKEEEKKKYVEFWMTENGRQKSVWVEKDRLFVLGMKLYPEVVDVTEMSESTSQVFQQLLTGSRRYSTRISMNEADEMCHVATELKLVNLLKIMEKDLIGQTSISMKQAVDSLKIAVKYEMKDAIPKLVDEIVFDFWNTEMLRYCKNGKIVVMLLKRKFELEADQPPAVPEWPPDPAASNPLFEDHPYLETQTQNQQVALPRVQQNSQIHKVILNSAKEKIRILLNRPITSFKNGIAWVASQNLRRQRQPARGNQNGENREFQNFPRFQNF